MTVEEFRAEVRRRHGTEVLDDQLHVVTAGLRLSALFEWGTGTVSFVTVVLCSDGEARYEFRDNGYGEPVAVT